MKVEITGYNILATIFVILLIIFNYPLLSGESPFDLGTSSSVAFAFTRVMLDVMLLKAIAKVLFAI